MPLHYNHFRNWWYILFPLCFFHRINKFFTTKAAISSCQCSMFNVQYSIYIPWKLQKTQKSKVFLTFSEGYRIVTLAWKRLKKLITFCVQFFNLSFKYQTFTTFSDIFFRQLLLFSYIIDIFAELMCTPKLI